MLNVDAQYRESVPLSVRVDRLRLSKGRALFVVRDDLLPAGTKQRAVIPLLRDFYAAGTREVTYASPFAGFAQVALAYGCSVMGIKCTLFCERDATQSGMRPHAFTKLARDWGAQIVLLPSLAEAEEAAFSFSKEEHALKIPLGFHCAEFQAHFQRELAMALAQIRVQLGGLPARAWLPLGSGTFAQAFRKASPAQMRLQCVNVHVLPELDLRIQHVRAMPGVDYFAVRERFEEPATLAPPVPSNLHYDSKLWRLLEDQAEDGDLWWNVAR